MTKDELVAKYPEGIPPWMLESERGYTPEQIDELMQLRRRAFPKTAPKRKLRCVCSSTAR